MLAQIIESAKPFFFSVVCKELPRKTLPSATKPQAVRKRRKKMKVSRVFRGECGRLWALRYASGDRLDEHQSLHHLNKFRDMLLTDPDTIPPDVASQLLCAPYPNGNAICFAAQKLGVRCWIMMNGCYVRCTEHPTVIMRIMGQTCLVTDDPTADVLETIKEDCCDVTNGLKPCTSYKKGELDATFRKLFPRHGALSKKEMYAYIASKVGKLT